jgi:hypothetical protein
MISVAISACEFICNTGIPNAGLPRHTLAMAKNGWFQRDCVKDTADVCGSVSQCHAPTAVHTDITARRTVKYDEN